MIRTRWMIDTPKIRTKTQDQISQREYKILPIHKSLWFPFYLLFFHKLDCAICCWCTLESSQIFFTIFFILFLIRIMVLATFLLFSLFFMNFSLSLLDKTQKSKRNLKHNKDQREWKDTKPEEGNTKWKQN